MDKITTVVKETLTNLRSKNIAAAPNAYHKEFCEVAKKYSLKAQDCLQFKQLVEKLSKEEQTELKEKDITTMEELVPVLLNRVAKKNVTQLADLLKDSATPSINVSLDESLAKFTIKINNSPELIFEEDIQKEMQKFITKRFEADRQVVKQKTADIARLVTLMGQYLNDAIHSSSEGSASVTSIKDEISSIEINSDGIQKLTNLQSKLISAAVSIETEMNAVGEKLHSGKSQVEELENKIQTLEEELSTVKKESSKDHLTGLLTRKAYEREAEKVEKNFFRSDAHYAIVFFDIDHFKAINDTYGHEGGDVVLKTFAKILKSQTRVADALGRYGGEEFIAVIQYKEIEEIIMYVTRIKKIIAQNQFIYQDKKNQYHFFRRCNTARRSRKLSKCHTKSRCFIV
jgi:diguanylate cyclase (GGDEF)-like protein